MTAAFGEVTYDTATAADASGAPGLDQATGGQPEVDMNDPRLVSEVLTINPEADAYAAPPSLPDGLWRAKVKQVDVKDNKQNMVRFVARQDKRGAPYLFTALEASIIDHDGKFDDVKITDYWVPTRINRGAMPVATICMKLGHPLSPNLNHRQAMDALLAALAPEPELGVETQWEWQCQRCQEEAQKAGTREPRSIRGMHMFVDMKDNDGKTVKNPQLICPLNRAHGISIARPRIVSYRSLVEVEEWQKRNPRR